MVATGAGMLAVISLRAGVRRGGLPHCCLFLTQQWRPMYPVKGMRRSARRGRRKRTIADLSRTKGWHDARRERGCRGHKGQNDGTAEHNVTLPSCASVKGARSACIHAPPPGTTLPEIRAPAGPETRACKPPVEGPAHTSSPIRSLHVMVGAGTARAAYVSYRPRTPSLPVRALSNLLAASTFQAVLKTCWVKSLFHFDPSTSGCKEILGS